MMDKHIYIKSFSVIHRFSTIYHTKMMKKAHISGHQLGYIMCVCMHPGVSQEGVSSFLSLDKGAVAKGMRPLVEMGYIERAQSKKDKRAYELYPTKKAKELQATAEKVNASLEELLTKGMTKEEQKAFKALLLKACDNVMAATCNDLNPLAVHAASEDDFSHKHCHHHNKGGGF